MKITYICIIGGVMLFGLCLTESIGLDLGYSSPEIVTSRRFILDPSLDLRSLFCTIDSIKDRSDRHVCTFEELASRIEIPVSTNTTCLDILNRLGMTNYAGGGQFRIVKKDSIVQCRYISKNWPERSNWEAFLNTKIVAADLVIKCAYVEP